MTQLPPPTTVPIDDICMADPFQVRVDGLDEDHVEALIAECETTGNLPPVVLVRRQMPEGIVYYIVDGHHEVEAQCRAGRNTVQAIVVDLNDADAIDLAWERNRRNAKPLSLADRLAHYNRLRQRQPSIPKTEIAHICGLSRSTVWRLENDVSRKHDRGASRTDEDRIVAYLRRVALDPIGWDSADDAAVYIRRAIPAEELPDFVHRLGDSGFAAVGVAKRLGYSAQPKQT